MQKIWIIGVTGSGKTTLGKNIAQKLQISAVDLDDLNWLPDWQSVSDEELVEAVNGVTLSPHWVLSGNYTITQKYLSRADTLIWLDYPFFVVFYQLIRRTSRRLISGESCCNGNRETLRKVLSRDSIIIWLFKTYQKRKRLDAQKIISPDTAHLQIHHFKSPRQTANWLQSLQSE